MKADIDRLRRFINHVRETCGADWQEIILSNHVEGGRLVLGDIAALLDVFDAAREYTDGNTGDRWLIEAVDRARGER